MRGKYSSRALFVITQELPCLRAPLKHPRRAAASTLLTWIPRIFAAATESSSIFFGMISKTPFKKIAYTCRNCNTQEGFLLRTKTTKGEKRKSEKDQNNKKCFVISGGYNLGIKLNENT